MKPARHLLLWDGDCGFCARCAHWLQAQDSKQLFEIAPHQSKSEAFLAQYELDHERCSQEIKLITSNQKVLGGAEAMNFFFEKVLSVVAIRENRAAFAALADNGKTALSHNFPQQKTIVEIVGHKNLCAVSTLPNPAAGPILLTLFTSQELFNVAPNR